MIHGQSTAAPAGDECVRTRDYFARLREDPKAGLAISRPQPAEPTNDEWSLVLARRLVKPDGIVWRSGGGGFCRWSTFKNGSPRSSWGRKARSLFAMRRRGLIVRHPRLKEGSQIGSTKIAEDFKAALQNDPAQGAYVSRATSIDGIQRVHHYRRNRAYGFLHQCGGLRARTIWPPGSGTPRLTVALVGLFLAVSVILPRHLLRSWKRQQAFIDQLDETQKRHHSLLHTSMDGFLACRPGGGALLEVNDPYCQMSGYSLQELAAMRVTDLEALETSDQTLAHLRRIMEEGGRPF